MVLGITIPRNILAMVDEISQARGVSRSKLISTMLEQKLAEEKATYLKNAYNQVFNAGVVCEEQIATAQWMDQTGNEEGQEW